MRALIIVIPLLFSSWANAQIQAGQICHADPEVTAYNYAGVWEKFEDGWICNYWQFLPEDEWEEVIIEEDGIETEKEK
ncbi:MAG: hypothetical protein SO424_01235 [[Pasteurella] aerogenes]|nr:hypothetical protein [[Pasteurella] aerogenes]